MVIKTGIDAIALYTSCYALDLTELAKANGLAEDKYLQSLSQITMSVPPPGEDIVTMAANAGLKALANCDVKDIAMLMFATESGIDQSKAAGLYVHDLLQLPTNCRIVELKQACYSATFALQIAMPFLRENPQKKILVIASDIARYGLGTTGESSQGAGACAMLLAANPRLIAFESEYGVMCENVMDFWRPNYAHEAMVDGKYSSKLYLTMLEKCFREYEKASARQYQAHDYFCYHTPVPRLVEKAHHYLQRTNNITTTKESAAAAMDAALHYARLMGNTYSASLYVSLASLFDLTTNNLSGKRIGFYSYGSGCVAEFFSGVVQPHYKLHLHTEYHQQLLARRRKISYQDYCDLYAFKYVEDGSLQTIPPFDTGAFKLVRVENHQRIYEKVSPSLISTSPSISISAESADKSPDESENKQDSESAAPKTRVYAPAKLILSGEHSVVYGGPALAMAIDRYAIATVNADSSPEVSVNLTNLAHQSRHSFHALRLLKEKVKQNYHRFIRGEFSIRDVLQKPFELAHFALGLLADTLHTHIPVPAGINIRLESNIPMGCGLGSSAATILSVLRALTNHLSLPLTDETLYNLALEAENMQHGKTSGLDLRIALNGGCIYMYGQEFTQRQAPQFPLYLVNTGQPTSSTGQCVAHTAKYFQSTSLKDEFASVTNAMDEALQQQSLVNLQETIRHNQKLLTHIGVVPEKIQSFVARIESAGGAAKVCGAGSVNGDHAGAVLVVHPDRNLITEQVEHHGYNILPIQCELRGVHAA